jgi:hypothetical protein
MACLAAGCVRSGAASGRATPAPNRVSVTIEQDFGLVSGSDICSKEAQLSEGFACFRSNGTQYHGAPIRDESTDPAGVYPATTRLFAGFDRVLFDNLTGGARAGFVLRGGGPRPDGADAPEFLPFHGELRAAYWFGAAPFTGPGFRLGLFAGGGIAQVDAAWRVSVKEDTKKRAPAAQPSNPPEQTLDAYKKSGTGFAGGGVTAAWELCRSSAFFLDLKLMALFPSSGLALAPGIGYEHGF